MAGKRRATQDLNHENWNQEDEPETAGTFQKATEQSIQSRTIKIAKRRNISSVRNEEEKSASTAFSSFTGFSKPAVSPSNAFSFLSNVTTQPSTQPEKSKINGFPENSNKTTDKNSDYYSKLKGLNESVSVWIKKHVDTNPLINLQPIFKDYEKYFKELEKEQESTSKAKPVDATSKKEEVSSMSTFVFKAAENIPDSTTGKLQQETEKSTSKINPMFSFGKLPPASTEVSKPSFGLGTTTSTNTTNQFVFGAASSTPSTSTFSFGSNASTVSNFSFSSSAPFAFGGAKPTSSENQQAQEDDDEETKEDEPQMEKIVESDHIFTIRCKVFVKKDDKFNVLGVGNLYIKPIAKSEKVQVIVRADNNLGNLLCNFVLSESIPIKRSGGKDVLLVCLPTPDVEPPPVPMIIRVKNSEDADKLSEVLEKHKK